MPYVSKAIVIWSEQLHMQEYTHSWTQCTHKHKHPQKNSHASWEHTNCQSSKWKHACKKMTFSPSESENAWLFFHLINFFCVLNYLLHVKEYSVLLLKLSLFVPECQSDKSKRGTITWKVSSPKFEPFSSLSFDVSFYYLKLQPAKVSVSLVKLKFLTVMNKHYSLHVSSSIFDLILTLPHFLCVSYYLSPHHSLGPSLSLSRSE